MSETSSVIPDGLTFPFECQNCGHKPTPQQVITHFGGCEKCGDTVIAYTVDTAEFIMHLMGDGSK